MQRSAYLPPSPPAPWARPGAALARMAERLADPADRPALLWRAFWWPFWVWSDAPPPALPRREVQPPAELGLAGQAVVGGIDRVRRRLWLSHALAAVCRGLWLGVVFAALLMLIDVLSGPTFDPRLALAVGGLFLLAGLVLAGLCQPSRALTARVLDRSFGLHERLTTALDDLGLGVPAPGERAPVVYLQMADAANAIAVLRGDRRLRPMIPVREIVLIVLAALILATLAFVRGLGGNLPQLADARVPPFTPAVERPADPEPSQAEIEAASNPPTVQQVLERSDRSSQARRDLQALASALADQAVTRPAAEQIARGDYDAAGDQLRQAASQAGDLSQNARSALSSDLQKASDAMQPKTNGLQEATQDAAAGLQKGGEPARQEMTDLADAVQSAGSQVVPQGELASQMRSAQQAQAQNGGADRDAASGASQPSDPSSPSSASGNLGSGVTANASTDANQSGQQQSDASGANQGEGRQGQPGAGQPGQSNSPGQGQQGGEGAAQSPGDGSRNGAGMTAGQDQGNSALAQQGGGAGTGEAAQSPGGDKNAAGASQPTENGQAAANPNVSNGGQAESAPNALNGSQEQLALPAGSGQQGVQTSADGGSALRGSGSGVTAGSGYAEQGDVGKAGPDSNRVPPQHRDTVERYFGGDQ
jgi:hypothetical protein